MNNGNFNDEVGTDPTTINTIETLDVPGQKEDKKSKKIIAPKTKNPDKKPNDGLKKVIFTVVVILLMALVSFGVYYYLNLGTKHANNTNVTVKLNDVIIEKGSSLPSSLLEYGTFINVDVSQCTLNAQSVNIDVVGTYTYQVVCNKNVYNANVIVKEKEADITGNALFKTEGSSYEVTDFVSNSSNYKVSFENESNVSSALVSSGGPYIIKINAEDNKSNTKTLNSILYVTEEEISKVVNCSKDNVTYRFAFNNSNNNIGVIYEINEFTYTEDEYKNVKNTIISDFATIEGKSGYILFDDNLYKISLVGFSNTNNETYDIINSNYTSNGYTCQ